MKENERRKKEEEKMKMGGCTVQKLNIIFLI